VAGVETRTIGREVELRALQDAYLRAYEGHGIVWAQLLSDPGIGKSRLLADLSDWMDLRPETYRLLRARACPDDANQPFALARRMWFDRFQIAMTPRWSRRKRSGCSASRSCPGKTSVRRPRMLWAAGGLILL